MTTFFVASLITTNLQASETLSKHQFYIGSGAYSSKYLAKGVHFRNFGDYLDDKWNGGDSHIPDDDTRHKAITKIAYSYRIHNNWSVTASHLTQDYEDHYTTGKIKANLIGAKYSYHVSNFVTISSGIAIGQSTLTYDNNNESKKSTAFQFNGAELKIGNQHLAGHLILGYGFEGLLQAGLSLNF